MAGESSGKADAVGTEDETQTDTFSLRTTVSDDGTHAHAPAVRRRSAFSLFSTSAFFLSKYSLSPLLYLPVDFSSD
ncbi:hypothetical protein F2Q69_00028676 [Brassica cretica]|uniref:Uncharacterized protein n=1 Tax=Brassica cretica TaxID=69181 RepID=A0A8S9RUG2_BRACR|nr:hypothetical protein F2Q69_00028676 [Brassica cretica]